MIDKQQFDAYSRAIGANSENVKAAVIALERDLSGLSGEVLTNAIQAQYIELVKRYGRYAAACALEFYQQQRADVADDYEPTIYEPNDTRLLAADVKQQTKNSTLEGALNNLGNIAIQRVNEYADETITRNTAADPAKPKWALVPHIGACAYCNMLAGLGWHYYKEGNIPRHPSCKCVPVVDFDADSPHLEGYDPTALTHAYNKAQRELFGGDPWDAWAALTEEEQAHYGTYDHFRRNKTLIYMNQQANR